MCYYKLEDFSIFMSLRYGIEVDEELVVEKSILFCKEELNNKVLSKRVFNILPDIVLINSYSYSSAKKEWIVCVASDADTSYPLFLYCLKDGLKIYEEILDIR